ncbi:MAG TPA: hypothetical protein VHG28_15080 [Longimicrobiaceae bacterium]|nr:hypothetical protein [Longimicrobiaceae bacterium]
MENPIAGHDEPAGQDHLPLPYYAATTRATPPLEEVRQRIPGWGVDLDHDERTAVPMEDFDPGATGAHWHFPERQPELWPRERSPEHGMLTPVFGTACPPKGLSGMIRKYAYTLSEGKSSHWLLLMAADRVDVVESMLESVLQGKPDNPITESGVKAEFTRGGLRSRLGQGRVDLKHQPLDALIVAAPWLIAGYAGYATAKALSRKRRARRTRQTLRPATAW